MTEITHLPERADGTPRVPVRPLRSFAISVAAAALLPIGVATAAPTSIALQRERVRTLELQVVDLNNRAATAQRSYDSARSRLVSLNRKVDERAAQLIALRRDRSTARSQASARLIAMYRTPRPSLAETIVTTGGISAGLSNWSSARRLADQDKRILVQLTQTGQRVTATKARLESARVEQRGAMKRIAETRSVLLGARSQRAALLHGARAQLSVFLRAEAQRQAQLAAAQRPVVRSAPVVVVPGTPPSAGGAPQVTAPTAPSGVLARIAQCESGGSPTIVSPSGQYRGKYQFDPDTWKANGGKGSDPASAPEAEQDRVAGVLYSRAGATPWPVCGRFAR